MTEIDRTIWKNAWRLAQERGWSIKEFADKSGASNKTFYAISSGNRGVGKALIGKMSAALGVSEQSLLLEDGKSGVAAESGYGIVDVVTIPPEVLEIYSSGNEKLKQAVTEYAASLMAQVKRIKLEQEALVEARGAASELKQPSQDIGKSIDEILDEAM